MYLLLAIIALTGFQKDCGVSPGIVKENVIISSQAHTVITNQDSIFFIKTEADFYQRLYASGELESLSPSILNEENKKLVSVGNGRGLFKVKCRRSWYLFEDDFSFSHDNSVTALVGFVSGSLAESSTVIDSKRNERDDIAVFSIQNHSAGIYVRNTNFFAYSYTQALTCISPWNSGRAQRGAGILVTPRHVVFAAHWNPAVRPGWQIRFIDSTNGVHTRTVLGYTNVVSDYGSGNENDIAVCVLDQDLDEKITPAKVLPSPEQTYSYSPFLSKKLFNTIGMSCLWFDQNENGYINYLISVSFFCSLPNLSPMSSVCLNTHTNESWTKAPIGGDSGSGLFVDVGNNQLALVTTLSTAYSGPYHGNYVQDINDTIAELDTKFGLNTGYQIGVVDLSAYPIYGD